jgi:hypothetical protein
MVLPVSFSFKICLDFDEDQFLGTEDLEKAVQHLTRDELTADEISLVCTKVSYIIIPSIRLAILIFYEILL